MQALLKILQTIYEIHSLYHWRNLCYNLEEKEEKYLLYTLKIIFSQF